MSMDIIIDHRIRDWIGIFRNYLGEYQRNKKIRDKVKSQKDYKEICNKNFISKCQSFGKNCYLLTENSFRARKYFLCKSGNGGHITERGAELQAAQEQQQQMPQMPMQNNMADMMKNNITMGLSTFIQYSWISHFFSGFILAKIPFPLTQKFRGMLQKGVDIQNLNVGYVSSLSLYFLILFGLSGLQKLILGGDDNDNLASGIEQMHPGMMMNPMMGGMPGMGGMGGGAAGGLPGMPGQGPDYKKMFETEKENVELIKHQFTLQNSDDILIQKLKRQLNK